MLVVCVMAGSVCFAQQAETETWQFGPAGATVLEERIEDAAIEDYDDRPIARIIFYDIAYPRDAEEYKNLDGHAVLVLSAISQLKEELPLKRVYVLWDGKEIELKLFRSWSQQTSRESITTQTYGAHRMNAIYLLPLYLRLQQASLQADFTRNRTNFPFAYFKPADLPEHIRSLPIQEPTGKAFSIPSLIQFINREYPDIIKKK